MLIKTADLSSKIIIGQTIVYNCTHLVNYYNVILLTGLLTKKGWKQVGNNITGWKQVGNNITGWKQVGNSHGNKLITVSFQVVSMLVSNRVNYHSPFTRLGN